MEKIELTRPKLIQGDLIAEDETVKFANARQNIRLPIEAHKTMRLMNGAMTLAELTQKIYSEEKSLSFQQVFRLIQHLAHKNLLENSQEVRKALQASQELEVEDIGSFETRVKQRNLGSDLDGESRYISAEIAQKLTETPLFRGIREQKIIQMTDQSKVRGFQKGLYIVRHGASTKNVFILLSGSVAVMNAQGEYLATLYPNSVFGEYAAFLNVDRTADVVTLEESNCLVINVEQIAESNIKSAAGLEEDLSIYEEMKRNVILSQTLEKSELFGQLPLDLIQLIIAKGSTLSKKKGEVIIREGDIGKSFFLLLRGGVVVKKGDQVVNHQESGDFFGEISLIKRMPRTATVECITDVLLLQITRDDFYQLLSQNMYIALYLEKEADLRLSGG